MYRCRDDLRPLFELAEDSPAQLDSYLHAGRVLIARSADGVIGHLQLVDGDRRGVVEIKNMAVRESWQGRFYQRQGFRMRSIEWDAFTPATGYPADLVIDGIAVRDRVRLDYQVDGSPGLDR